MNDTSFRTMLRHKSQQRAEAMLDGMYRAMGVRLTDTDARESIGALTDGVQDALASWLPPDHPERVPTNLTYTRK